MAQVTFSFNPTPGPACYPSDVNGLAQLLTNGGILAGTIPDTAGGGIFVGSVPPTSAATTRVWFRTDGAGRPTGVYMFYNGNWRLVYTGRPFEIKYFSGKVENYFDGTGLGLVGQDWDGWAICNGNNGTPDLRDRFIVSANAWDDALGWETIQNGNYYTRGGQGQITLVPANLPPLRTSGIYHSQAASGTGTTVYNDDSINAPTDRNIVGNPGGQLLTSTPVPTLPPFVAYAPVIFVGYA